MAGDNRRPPVCQCKCGTLCGKDRFEALLREQAKLLKRAWLKISRLESALAARDGPDGSEVEPKPSAGPAHPVTPMALAGFAPDPRTRGEAVTTVPHPADMPPDDFLRHLSMRHESPGPGVAHTVASFRSYHALAHVLANGQAGHVHAESKTNGVQ